MLGKTEIGKSPPGPRRPLTSRFPLSAWAQSSENMMLTCFHNGTVIFKNRELKFQWVFPVIMLQDPISWPGHLIVTALNRVDNLGFAEPRNTSVTRCKPTRCRPLAAASFADSLQASRWSSVSRWRIKKDQSCWILSIINLKLQAAYLWHPKAFSVWN